MDFNNKISGSIPDSIKSLIHLNTIDLSNTKKLDYLPVCGKTDSSDINCSQILLYIGSYITQFYRDFQKVMVFSGDTQDPRDDCIFTKMNDINACYFYASYVLRSYNARQTMHGVMTHHYHKKSTEV